MAAAAVVVVVATNRVDSQRLRRVLGGGYSGNADGSGRASRSAHSPPRLRRRSARGSRPLPPVVAVVVVLLLVAPLPIGVVPLLVLVVLPSIASVYRSFHSGRCPVLVVRRADARLSPREAARTSNAVKYPRLHSQMSGCWVQGLVEAAWGRTV